MDRPDNTTVGHAPDEHRYEVRDGETVVGAAHYVDVTDPRPGERIFYHTTVDDDHLGQGLGARLAQFALDDTARAGLAIVPLCPFIKAYVQRHPQYRNATVAIRPEHLAALSSH